MRKKKDFHVSRNFAITENLFFYLQEISSNQKNCIIRSKKFREAKKKDKTEKQKIVEVFIAIVSFEKQIHADG